MSITLPANSVEDLTNRRGAQSWTRCAGGSGPGNARPCADDGSLTASIGPLRLVNPVLLASGTYAYESELAGLVDLPQLGGIVHQDDHREAAGGVCAAAYRGVARRDAECHRAAERRCRAVRD